jgi:predicted DNA-binding transcriptional regulator AlpA
MKSAPVAILKAQSINRLALRRNDAAAALSISPSLFDNWVRDGLMPRGKRIGGVMLWDMDMIRSAWQALVEDEPMATDNENPFDHLVA